MVEPHHCHSCQFCIPILGKNKEIARLECWKNPPQPVYAGNDANGKPTFLYMRPKVEGPHKCSEWKEKKMGFW